MSLALAGRTLDEKLVVACDSRSLLNNHVEDDKNKIFLLSEDSVGIGAGDWSIMNGTANTISRLLTQGTDSRQMHDIIRNDPVFRYSLMAENVGQAKFGYPIAEFELDFLYCTLDGKKSRIEIFGNGPVLKTGDEQRSNVVYPIGWVGTADHAQHAMAPMAYFIPALLYSEFMKPLFAYLVQHTADHDPIVGREARIAELSQDGFRWLSQDEMDIAYANAEKVRNIHKLSMQDDSNSNKYEALGELIFDFFGEERIVRVARQYIGAMKRQSGRLAANYRDIAYSMLESFLERKISPEATSLMHEINALRGK